MKKYFIENDLSIHFDNDEYNRFSCQDEFDDFVSHEIRRVVLGFENPPRLGDKIKKAKQRMTLGQFNEVDQEHVKSLSKYLIFDRTELRTNMFINFDNIDKWLKQD